MFVKIGKYRVKEEIKAIDMRASMLNLGGISIYRYICGTLLLLIIFWIFGSQQVLADKFDFEEFKKSLPKQLGASNYGTEFYFTLHPCWENGDGLKEIKVYASSYTTTDVRLEVAGKAYTAQKTIYANEVVEFDLSPGVALCYQKKEDEPPQPDAVFSQFGIHLTSDMPVIAYCIAKFETASDGFLILPVGVLGNHYIISSYVDPSDNSSQWFPSYTSIVAAYDDTDVSFVLGGNFNTETTSGMVHSNLYKKRLMKGDVWLISSKGSGADLSGSIISSSKPIAVVSGSYCSNVPSDVHSCGYLIEMETADRNWGRQFYVSNLTKRKRNSIIKIYARQSKTNIYRDGQLVGNILTPGGVEGVGYLHMRVDADPAKPVVISSDKPIQVVQYNTGYEDDDVNSSPFQMTLIPCEQMQQELQFNTPGVISGSSFPEHYFNLCYSTNEDGTIPDDLLFGKVFNNKIIWEQVKASDPSPGDEFKIRYNGQRYFCKKFSLPGDGVYRFKSTKPMSGYLYGISSNTSYGYPASMNQVLLDKNDYEAPIPRWTQECDGSVLNGTVTDMPDDDKIRSNLGMILFHINESYNYQFKSEKFIPGETRTTTWQLFVKDPTKDARALITFTDRRGNDTTIMIEYTAFRIKINPSFIDFGIMKKGDVKEIKFWIVNESEVHPYYVSNFKLKKGDVGFKILLSIPSIKIKPRDSAEFKIRFTATEEGEFYDSIAVGDVCLTNYYSTAYAKVASAIIEATNVQFSDVTIGKKVSQTAYIINKGLVPLFVTAYSGPQKNQIFEANYRREISPNDVLVVNPGERFSYSVTFSPLEDKYYEDYIVFSSDAKTIDSVCIINGRGVKAGLVANSYDWGKRRISRNTKPEYYIPPYSPDNGTEIIKLENSGTEKVIITGIEIISEKNSTAFIFDKSRFNYLEIPAGGSTVVPVKFHPEKIGDYELIFKYKNSANSNTETVLKGVGTLPKVIFPDVNFDTSIVNDFTNPVVRNAVIYSDNCHYCDKLTLKDLKPLPNDNSIGIDGIHYSQEGFLFNKDSLHLPIELMPGDSLVFPARFVPQIIDKKKVELQTVSDAEEEATSTWYGAGLSQLIKVTGDTISICSGTVDTLICTVENIGIIDLAINFVAFEQYYPEFSFVNIEDTKQFVLAPGEFRRIKILYQPSMPGTSKTNVIINNSTQDNPEARITIVGNSMIYNLEAMVSPMFQSVSVNSEAIVKIFINNEIDTEYNKIKELDIELRYNGDFLYLQKSNISLGKIAEGKFILDGSNIFIDNDSGIARIHIESVSEEYLSGKGELLKLKFWTYLPKDSVNSADISFNIRTNEGKCLNITTQRGNVSLKPTCAFELRRINISNYENDLKLLSNATTVNEPKIEFSLAFDGLTKIEIYNYLGELIATILSEELKSGAYRMAIDAEKLTSGPYICRMVSGNFEKSIQFLLLK